MCGGVSGLHTNTLSCESVGVYMPMCVGEIKRQLWLSVFIFQLMLEKGSLMLTDMYRKLAAQQAS